MWIRPRAIWRESSTDLVSYYDGTFVGESDALWNGFTNWKINLADPEDDDSGLSLRECQELCLRVGRIVTLIGMAFNGIYKKGYF